MRFVAVLFLCATVGACRGADWSLELGPPPGKPLPNVIHVGDPAPVFTVQLKNVSNGPLMVWKEWCSFGYFNLYYRVTRANGQEFDLRRMRGSWSWNYPDGAIIRPGDFLGLDGSVAPENADPHTEVFPANWVDGEKVQLRAVYKEASDPTMIEDFQKIEKQRRARIASDPVLDEKTRKLMLARAGDELRHYLEAWTGKVVSAPIFVVLDRKSLPASH